jgi:AcrR family transcriptional regulator
VPQARVIGDRVGPAVLTPRPDQDRAVRAARRMFMAGERIDMKRLASELDVDRSTLFRWVGNRDQLIVAVLMSLTDGPLRLAIDGARGVGGARIAHAARLYSQTLIDTSSYRAFLQKETERALRLTTTKASPLQQHVVKVFEGLLRDEERRGAFTHAMASDDLAYLIVRVIESFIYSDLITGDDPDAGTAGLAIAALLRSDVVGDGST